jgi:hypothetical protein
MSNRPSHIRLNSHPGAGTVSRFPLNWGAPTAQERGPVIGTVNSGSDRNAIGAHGGAYSVYRALAVSSGAMSRQQPARPDQHRADHADGAVPAVDRRRKIVSLDPWGARVAEDFAEQINAGRRHPPDHRRDPRPHINCPRSHDAIAAGRLKVDGRSCGQPAT